MGMSSEHWHCWTRKAGRNTWTSVLLVCLVLEESLLSPFQVKALLVSVTSCGWRWVDEDVPWFVVTLPIVSATNMPMCCGHKCSAVLPFAFLSAPGHSVTSEDTVTPATMSFKDIWLNCLERVWCLSSWAGWSLLLWLSSMKTRVSLSK